MKLLRIRVVRNLLRKKTALIEDRFKHIKASEKTPLDVKIECSGDKSANDKPYKQQTIQLNKVKEIQ